MAPERVLARRPSAPDRRPAPAAVRARAAVEHPAERLRRRLGNEGTATFVAHTVAPVREPEPVRDVPPPATLRLVPPPAPAPSTVAAEPAAQTTAASAPTQVAPEGGGPAPEREAVAPSPSAREPAAEAKAPETEGGGAPGGTAQPAPAAKKPPSPRQAIAPTIGAVRKRAAGARTHQDPKIPIASAQGAAKTKSTEEKRGTAAATVKHLDSEKEKTKAVKKDSFKALFKKAIHDATPKPTTESAANQVVESGAKTASATMQGQLATQRDEAVGPLKSAAATEVAVSASDPPPLQPEPLGPKPAPVSAAPVVPPPLPPERLDYSADRAPTDKAMAENNVTKAQLEKGNEPAFGETLDARSTAEQHEAEAEAKYRKSEGAVQAGAEKKAQAALSRGLDTMHGARALGIGQVVGKQLGTHGKDYAERQRITDTIQGIKNDTKKDVDRILKEMEADATRVFGEGLKAAEKAYRDTFEEEKGGLGTWLTTWGDDWRELIENSLATARLEYLRQVDLAIDEVANIVDSKLEEAKHRVEEGSRRVDEFVGTLDTKVKSFGEEARDAVKADFQAMTAQIDERRDALVNTLTQQFKESYDRMSAMEEELRAANKSLWDRIYDATIGLIKKILAFKDMLLSILRKAADVILDIISDPIGFLGNLVSGVMLGLKNFMGNIGKHLQKGLLDWLFGALGGAGLKLPDTLDLKGIISIVLQILGLTYANFRARAVAIVGEPVVAALEKAAEVFKIVMTEGVPGLWRFIKEKLEDLKSMVLDAIFDFIKEKVIIAGVTWIIGLLNPASAFFKACKAIYDIVMFFINRGSQILALVNAVIDSMAAIAKGSIGVAAKFVEDALAKAIPVAIGFLASLLGLGDISGTIRNTINKAQAPVNKAIDWVITQAVKLVKAAGKFIGGVVGKKEPMEEEDPQKAAKIEAGLVFLHATELAESKEEGGELTPRDAAKVAASVKQKHPVFKTLVAVPTKEGGWEYDYTASPGRKEPSPLRRRFDDDQIFLMVRDIARVRFAGAQERAAAKAAGQPPSLAIKPGDAPAELAAQIQTRAESMKPKEVKEKQGSTVPLQVGESTVFAKQGSGAANLIIAGLGTYPEIVLKLERQGFDGPKIHASIMEALRTGKGHPDIMRLTALIFGVEPARLEITAVTGPLVTGELGKGSTPGQAWGEGKGEFGGGFDPASMEKAAKAGRRADETLVEGRTFREGTLIHERTEEFIQRVVELVFQAVKGEKIAGADQLRARIMVLLEQFDQAAGVK